MKQVATVPFLCVHLALCGAPAALAGGAEPVAHWLFDAAHLDGNRCEDLAGESDAVISGPVLLGGGFAPGALLVDGERNRVDIEYDPASSSLPRKALSVEAWVAVEKTVEWGGIIGAIEDSGGKGAGWLLGFRQSSFSFGLAAAGADGRLTHIRSRASLEWGRWYHVVGTYDGESQRLYVNGRLEGSSTEQTGEISYPRRASYVIGAFIDEDQSFRPRSWIHEVRVYAEALSAAEVAAIHRAKTHVFPAPLELAVAPSVERRSETSVRISWVTRSPCPSVLAFGAALPLARAVVHHREVRTAHAVTIDRLERERIYYYRLFSSAPETEIRGSASRLFEFDSTFDYTPQPVRIDAAAYPQTEKLSIEARLARDVLERSGVRQGYCLILGCSTGELAYEIARRTELRVVCVDDDEETVAALRRRLDEAGLYGVRVSVHHGSLEKLAYANYIANLVLSERTLTTGELATPAAEALRVLRPSGGVACFGAPGRLDRDRLEEWFKAGSVTGYEMVTGDAFASGAPWAYLERAPLAGGGSWSHQYGDPGNSSSSQDDLVRGPMRVLWFGRPGPRPMVDRGTRAPAPLSVGGRLFVQGDRRLFGLDAYNGTILWTLEVPDLRRANMPRDSSNMVATEDSLYVAVRDRCWRLDAGSGRRLAALAPPPAARPAATEGVDYDWGYLACAGDTLFGSLVRRGGVYIGADGEWYDKKGEESMKVVSDAIFALDRTTGETKWVRAGGLAINATVSLGDGRLYMVESRNPAARKVGAGRLGDELRNDRYLVAVDAETGADLWDRYYDFEAGSYVFYLSYSQGTLVALSTSDRYHMYAFDAAAGELLWKESHDWNRDHHGGAMQHPVIVGDVVYAEPNGYRLRTGEVVHTNLPARSGCGALAGSKRALFFRDGDHSMWDLETNTRKRFSGIRPGCWLSIINAGGIVLAPETSAGCYCANPIQTSVAFYPLEAR